MGSFWDDPFGWAKNEAERWQGIQYSPNVEVKKAYAQTGAGQKIEGAEHMNPDAWWTKTDQAKDAMDASKIVDKELASNRPDVNGPFGSTDWNKDANGNWTMNQSFNGPMSGIANSLQQQMAQALGRPIMGGNEARQQAIDSAYGQATSRLNPQWDQREKSLESKLMNQGLDPTSKAYATALQNFGRDRNDAFSSAMNGAIGQGTMAGQAIFNQNMMARNAPMASLQGLQSFLPGAPQGGGGNYMGALKHAQGLQDKRDQAGMDVWNGAVDLTTSII
jgi:hypothetical protein